MKNRKIAVIHDWLSVNGGAEIVLKHILALCPNADVYTMVDILPLEQRTWLDSHKIYTSPLQRFNFIAKRYRYFIPLMPYLVEQFDLSRYDMIISSSHAVAKGVIVHPHQKHIAYIYSPMRYAWDSMYEHERLGVFGRGLMRLMLKRWLHKMRIWDYVSAQRPDILIADSDFIKQRIQKSWRREADIVYPPVEFDECVYTESKSDYYVTLSRLVEYKRIDIIVEAFNQMPDKKLIVIGDGVSLNALQKMANSNIIFTGYLPRKEAMGYISKAKAFIFMAKEDFGIAPIEASACGTPIIAYKEGGACETVIHCKTGIFVEEQTSKSLIYAIDFFEHQRIDAHECMEHAFTFSVENFKKKMLSYIEIRNI
ncbi:GDP-mannose-dependent alpha-(1-6)-phosphatidylinositol monomannoside mannosyltransferase [Sulfurospirillum diekertiae]|uniref:GDP-mannose-dependent alpha-(1-6)-phosphatidylinositol monomannoside mannosyltransferase n=1 Tax=Sulfurospirillum diekertiae TaxID=1854492 RepID=A0A290HHH5_9BACT|nr:glycosyltransferase [Sulfurospirillum diekertiae]ATB70953.1 GDP-mannose-dependent alpha-(1-6)-phosphatidylinositol monomannoside mannosyltransferase [Sulfurospirillum diekertiae]